MLRPFSFFFGSRRLRVLRSAAGEIMNLFRVSGYTYSNFEFCGDYAYFSCSAQVSKSIIEACAARGISVSVEKESGIPFILKRYRHRYGVFIGILLCFFLIFLSGRVVWDIRVEGNRYMSEEEVISELRECGFRIGALKSGLDIDAIEMRTLVFSENISWISINLLGTVANVEIREMDAPPKESTPDFAAANLVAARGGVIEDFQDVRGEVVVKIGDIVGEGDLLVSGLYGDEKTSFRYTCAKGEVLARTSRDFSVEIPLKYTDKAYSEKVKCEKFIIFFEKEVKFTINSGNLPLSCDTIEMVEYFHTRGGSRLPVGIRTVRHCEYEWRSSERTAEQAMTLAYDELRAQMDREIPDAMLMRKRLYGEQTDSAYVLHATIECIENIARVEEIKIKGISD